MNRMTPRARCFLPNLLPATRTFALRWSGQSFPYTLAAGSWSRSSGVEQDLPGAIYSLPMSVAIPPQTALYDATINDVRPVTAYRVP